MLVNENKVFNNPFMKFQRLSFCSRGENIKHNVGVLRILSSLHKIPLLPLLPLRIRQFSHENQKSLAWLRSTRGGLKLWIRFAPFASTCFESRMLAFPMYSQFLCFLLQIILFSLSFPTSRHPVDFRAARKVSALACPRVESDGLPIRC